MEKTGLVGVHLDKKKSRGYRASPRVWPLRLLPAADSAGTRRLRRRAAPTAAAMARRVAVVLASGGRGVRASGLWFLLVEIQNRAWFGKFVCIYFGFRNFQKW